MTAEIAILNKLGVALAADSAVTIGRPPNAKIYNTVNKIFELSSHEPIGIMVYGRLDFMGIPYEPLIKEYRKKALGKKAFDHICDYAEDFRKHLAKSLPFSDEDDRLNVAAALTEAFATANAEIEALVRADMGKTGKFLRSKVNPTAQTHLLGKIDALKAEPFAPGFKSARLPARYSKLVENLVGSLLPAALPNATTTKLAKVYAGYLLSKAPMSAYRAGIVVAGFGKKEIFPSLARIEVDGVINGKLKYKIFDPIDIDRAGPQADILGFAQEDMIRSFLDGIDPSLRKYVEKLIESTISKTFDMVCDVLIGDPTKQAAFRTAAQPQIDGITNQVKEEIDEHVEEYSADPIRDMVRSMPKQELATLASSLIEITSLKRKVSKDQETVGGDVDVAIISKSEGFVWIKRKHYFPSEPNRRFFIRQAEDERAGK